MVVSVILRGVDMRERKGVEIPGFIYSYYDQTKCMVDKINGDSFILGVKVTPVKPTLFINEHGHKYSKWRCNRGVYISSDRKIEIAKTLLAEPSAKFVKQAYNYNPFPIFDYSPGPIFDYFNDAGVLI